MKQSVDEFSVKGRSDATRFGDCLVLGYGNELRGDDGAGPFVAREVDALSLPGVRVRVSQQLAPELAEEIANAGRVLFVDAAIHSRRVVCAEVFPAPNGNVIEHCNSPAAMLALAQAVFGHAPPAFLVTVPATNLNFSLELSAETQQHALAAVEQVRRLASLR